MAGSICSVSITMCLWYHPRLSLGFWGPWGYRKWDLHMVNGFWAEGVPVPLCHTALWAPGAAYKLKVCLQAHRLPAGEALWSAGIWLRC